MEEWFRRFALYVLITGLLGEYSVQAEQKFDVSAVKGVHADATSAVLVKGKSLDAPAPPELTNKLDSALGKPPGSDKDLKYKDVLRQSEGALAQHGEKVSVTVNANPDSCHVTYRAISGGGAQDFGDTLVKKSVDPKTYEFVCKCTDQLQPKKVVDCTEDQNLDFDCKR